MTREQTIEAIKVMQGFVDGKEVECEHTDGVWMLTTAPCWNWHSGEYRIKPTYRPWTADEVPLGAWMRFKILPNTRLIISYVTSSINFKQWLEDREHSTDGGKTWLPCGVEESK